MGTKKLSALVLLSFISFIIITCKHEIPLALNGNTGSGGDTTANPNPVIPNTCSADTVYFSNYILPVINSSCATTGCHDAITHKEGINLTSYSNIKNYVVPFNVNNSKLYKVITQTGENKMPPSPMSPLTADQIAKIKQWINQGALNNQCSGGCDTATFAYSGAVSVTMNNYCKGCHNPSSLGGGIDLSTYTGVKAAALGRLMGSINHSTGFSSMPKGGNKLSDCQITQIQKWIQAGTPNN